MKLHANFLHFTLLLGLLLGVNALQGQTIYTFTPCGATGNTGPTQGMVNTAYTGTNLDGDVTSIGGIQYWVVPATGDYLIEAYGGQGYGSFGGRGAHISGEFLLFGGDTLKILVGQLAGHYLNYPSTTYNHQFGGGGGSFVTTTGNTPLVIAGGGGGNHGTSFVASCDGQAGNNGAAGANASGTGAGGTSGLGGQQATSADGGGGLLGNGNGTAGGQSFVNGGLGGIDEGTGGFGCGGGTSSWNNYRGGGGGGYSGGGGGNNGSTCCPAGGGGGSFNAGNNPVNLAGVQTGDGLIRITSLTRYPNDAGITDIRDFTPPVCTGTYPVEVEAQNYGNNVITQITIGWSVNGVFQGDTTVATLIDTIDGSGPDTLSIVLGTVNINTATTIRAWTAMPNSVTDSSGLNDTMTINIAAPAVVTAIVDDPILCNGGSDGGVTATGSGGTPGYTYLWSTTDTTASVSNLSSGNYSVVVTDGDNCTDTYTIFVPEPTALTSMENISDISCNGETDGQVVINPVGGTPGYLTVFATGDTSTFLDNLGAGSYAYTITDANGCTFMSSASLTEPTAVAVSGTTTDETATANGAIDLTVSGGTSPYTYLWSNGATTEDLSGIVGGTYTVVVTDANGCQETTTFTVNSSVGIEELAGGISCELYPNPNQGTFKVSVKDIQQPLTIEVMDLVGHRIFYQENADPLTEITLNEQNGVYLVKIATEDRSVVKRVVINR